MNPAHALVALREAHNSLLHLPAQLDSSETRVDVQIAQVFVQDHRNARIARQGPLPATVLAVDFFHLR